MTKDSIGRRLREIRGPRPMVAMADKMGCSAQQISNMEKGRISDSWVWLRRLHEEEGIDLNWLIGGNGA